MFLFLWEKHKRERKGKEWGKQSSIKTKSGGFHLLQVKMTRKKRRKKEARCETEPDNFLDSGNGHAMAPAFGGRQQSTMPFQSHQKGTNTPCRFLSASFPPTAAQTSATRPGVLYASGFLEVPSHLLLRSKRQHGGEPQTYSLSSFSGSSGREVSKITRHGLTVPVGPWIQTCAGFCASLDLQQGVT